MENEERLQAGPGWVDVECGGSSRQQAGRLLGWHVIREGFP